MHRCVFADGGIIINEIMYDSDGSDIDWVEVYNSGTTDVDLTTLKLLISNSTSNHGINNSSGSSVLHPGDYGVIVASADISAFNTKWSTVGNIFTASFSLPNDTATVQINAGDKTQPISSVTYASTQGASGDGNSLQLLDGSWVVATPTPGAENEASVQAPPPPSGGSGLVADTDTSSESDANTNSTSAPSATSTKAAAIQAPLLKTKIVAKTVAFTGVPISFQASTTGNDLSRTMYEKYFWNFGDGDSKEEALDNAQKFTHTYFYPGQYNVSLEYFQYTYEDTPDAIDKITIQVVPANFTISSVGDEKDFFVEISNNSGFEADLSGWMLEGNNKTFFFPQNTIISVNQKIIISPKVSGFSIADKNNLKLANPEGDIIFDYGASLLSAVAAISAPVQPAKISVQTSVITASNTVTTATVAKAKIKAPTVATSIKIPAKNNIIPPVALSAALIESAPVNSNKSSAFLGLSALVVGSSSAVYFMRRKKIPVPVEKSDGFEILDE